MTIEHKLVPLDADIFDASSKGKIFRNKPKKESSFIKKHQTMKKLTIQAQSSETMKVRKKLHSKGPSKDNLLAN